MRRLALIWWFGGKGNMIAKLLQYMPPHLHYVEPFGGAASLLLNKPRCGGVETYNDLNSGLVNLFRVVADARKFAEFRARVKDVFYSREIYNEYRATWAEQADDVEKAKRFFVVASWSFSGHFAHSFSTVVEAARRGMAGTCATWLSRLDKLPRIHARLRGVQIENLDWRVILERYSGPDYLAYCDPPYVPEMRKSGEYKHEMTAIDHGEFVNALLAYPGMVMLSGYASEIYRPLERAGWKRKEWQVTCYAAGCTRATGMQGAGTALAMQPRTESLWLNPRAAEKLAKRRKRNGNTEDETGGIETRPVEPANDNG